MNTKTTAAKASEASLMVAAARNLLLTYLTRASAAGPAPEEAAAASCPDLRWAPEDPRVAETELLGRYPSTVLLDTRCFTSQDGDAPRLISGLRRPDSPVLLIYDNREALVDIVAEGRHATAPSIDLTCLRNLHTRRRIKASGGALICAPDVRTVAAWMPYGLAAVPLPEAPLTGGMTSGFWKALRSMSLPSDRTGTATRISHHLSGETLEPQREPIEAVPVVADWDPITFQRLDDRGAEVVDRITPNGTHSDEVAVWSPSDATLGHLQRGRALNDVARLAASLKHSLRSDLKGLPSRSAPSAPVARPARTLVELRALVSNQARRGLDPESGVRAYLGQVEAELIAPLLCQGATEDAALAYVEGTLLRRFAAVEIAAVRAAAISTTNVPFQCAHGDELNNLAKLILDIELTRRGERHGRNRRRR